MLNYDYYKFYIFEDFDKKIGDQNSDKSKSYRFFHKYYSRTLKKKKEKETEPSIFLSFHFQGNKIEIKFNDIRCYYETKSVQKDRARKRRGGGRRKRIRFAGAEAKKDGSNKREVRRGSE